MMAKDKYTFKDGIVPKSSGSPDLNFEGPAKFANPDFNINGAKVITVVGEGHLDECLKELE